MSQEKNLKINHWLISTVVLGFLLLVMSVLFFLSLQSQEKQPNNMVIDKIYIHKTGGVTQLVNPSSADYQKIKSITTKIIGSTLKLPVERRKKIKLAINQEAFVNELEQSDYIEILSNQLINDELEKNGYDRVVFILRTQGHYNYSGIFGHNIKYKESPNPHRSWWPWWGPYNKTLFWDLGEFLDVPGPTPPPTGQTRRQSQITSGQTSPIKNQNILLAELQRLDIEVKDQWGQGELRIPSILTDANWGLKKEICKEGGYNLTAYAGKTLLFTSYLTNEILNNEESLLVWILNDGNEIACVYKTVLESSSLIPGVFSIRENPNIRKR